MADTENVLLTLTLATKVVVFKCRCCIVLNVHTEPDLLETWTLESPYREQTSAAKLMEAINILQEYGATNLRERSRGIK